MRSLLLLSLLSFISLFSIAQVKDSTTTRLEQYKKWVDQGLITADEYAALKQRLLKPRRLWDEQKGTSHFGIKAGILLGLNDKENTINDKSAPQPSYTAGIFYEFDRGHFMFQTELDVNGKSGYKNRPIYYFNEALTADVGYTTSVNRINLEIPVLFGGRLGNWSIYAGPVMSTDVYAFIKSTDTYYDYNNVLQTDITIDRTKLGFETDFIFGVGYSVPIKKKSHQAVVLDLRYANNMPGSDVYNRYATFTAGYKF